MKNNRHAHILAAILLMLIASVPLRSETGMLQLLNLTGARQAAMGETTVLFDYDPFNLEYNPAVMAGLEKGQAGFSHHSSFLDWNTSTLAVIFPVKGIACGIHMRYSGYGDIEGRRSATSQPEFYFDAQDFTARAFAAMTLTPKLKAGLSVGWLMEKIDTYRASSVGVGLGLVYQVNELAVCHASVANLGPGFKFKVEENDLPTIYRVGASARKYGATVTAEYVNIKSGDSHIHMGGEYLIQEYLYLRTGYQTGYDTKDFSAGAGFVYNSFRVDYAFVPYDSDLGDSHRFTLTVSL